jgi:CO/xanthine dehydrogenase Mo-binding subunit
MTLPEMLHAKVLRSPFPHARIVSMEISAAEKVPGVAAIFTAADVERGVLPSLFYGLKIKDEPVVALDRVRFVGEPVALVAAETLEAAEEALTLIQVEYDELPSVFDVLEAREANAPALHEDFPDNCFVHAKLRHGDLEAGFAQADLIVEETYTSPVAQQTSLEPHVAIAQWQGDHLTVWAGTQAPYPVRAALAGLFEIPPENVRVIVPPLGGGYGGKGHIRIEPMAAALARKTNGRPVKLALTRAEEFVTVTKHAAVITIKSGVKTDGTFTARQVTLYWNAGAYSDASPMLVPAGMVRSLGPYCIPVAHVDAYGIYTNLPPSAAYRGAMSSQTTWAYESHMDTLAHRLGIDPLEMRRKSILHSGDEFATGEILHDVHFAECLNAAAASLDKKGILPNTGEDHLKRGRGVAVMMKSTLATSRSECRLVMNDEGRVTVFTSTVEMGQGAHTAMAQVAAEAVGVSVDQVTIVGPDTDQTPFDSTTSASRSSNMMSGAIASGGVKMKRQLCALASPLLEHDADDLVAEEGVVYALSEPAERVTYTEVLQKNGLESIDAEGMFATKGGIDPETGQGLSTPHWHQGAGACEVEVDTETGKVSILQYAGASFAGRVINPRLATLQNEGNVVFGLGPAMLEEIVVDHGQIVNPNLSDYMIPSFLDVPVSIDSILIESEENEIHGIGEMTLPPVAPAIANAIYDAVGVRITGLPITAEKVLRAIWEKEEASGNK